MTKKSKSAETRAPDGQTDTDEEPLDVINEHLNQATATLDLMFGLSSSGGCAGAHLEELREYTLSTVAYGLMQHIERAQCAARELHAQWWTLKRAAEGKEAQS